MQHLLRQTILACLALLAASTLAQAQTANDYNDEGVEHYTERRFSDAIAAFRRAHDIAPENKTVRTNLSNALQAQAGDYARENEYKEAIQVLDEAVTIEPENPEPLTQMGAYYLMEGDIHKAIFRLEEAIELSPSHIDAHFLLGEAYFKDHDVSSALDQWRWVEQVNPDLPGLKDRLETALKDEQIEHYFKVFTSPHFHIRYSNRLRGSTLRSAVNVLETAYRDIGRDLGAFPHTPIAVTLYTAESFTEATQLGGHVGAVYDGSRIRCPVVDENGDDFPEDEIRRRLIHEYVHVVVRHVAKDRAPWWFNEGLAETYSREQSHGERQYLKRAWDEKKWFALEELHESQLEKLNVELLQLGYIQSHATVQFLRDRFGTQRLGQYLRMVAEGENPEAVLRRTCRYTYRSLESEVAATL